MKGTVGFVPAITPRALFVGVLVLLMLITGSAASAAPQKVTTYHDDKGWKLLVDGESFYVKGMVWNHTPIGENYTYSLWTKPEQQIKDVLDHDAAMMKKAGINAIRTFSGMPPEWVAYLYEEHGIMSIVNHFMGRYGHLIGGVWQPNTDYGDQLTRDTLKAEILQMVRDYKDTPGLLMFALGNENNYGLFWKGAEVEDIPLEELYIEDATNLYTLFNEIIVEAKEIDSTHPYLIVNGDLQFIDLIKEHVTALDVLGSNVYRGKSFTDLWAKTKDKLNLPVVFTEFGSDAYNAVEGREDQGAQAYYLREQWREMYAKSYGHGEEGNSIGGFVFQWRDEWWKTGLEENLHVHDTNASWSNGGYQFDFVKQGINNMNEEWLGICQLGMPDENGVSEATPRMAYYVLSDIWKLHPYTQTTGELNEAIDSIDMGLYAAQADIRVLQQDKAIKDSFRLTGGSFMAEFLVGGMDNNVDEDGKEGLYFDHGELLSVDFGFNPSENLFGRFTVNLLGNVADKQMEINYAQELEEVVEIYDFEATLKLDSFDLETFYHTPRYHWKYEGDFFGLLHEATDIKGVDVWADKAPFGVQFTGKKHLDGLRVVFGPEVYWGANPKIIGMYSFGDAGLGGAIAHSEDIARKKDSSSSTDITESITRATTLYLASEAVSGLKLEFGAIAAGSEKIGDDFSYMDDGEIKHDEIGFADTLGAKFKATISSISNLMFTFGGAYQGLVANGGEPLTVPNGLKEYGTLMPHTEDGNRMELEAGVGLHLEKHTLYLRSLWRDNLIDANENIEPAITGATLYPGMDARNREDDPFAVLDNRKATSLEVFYTFDPTPATAFYSWNTDDREDAPVAFNIGLNYTDYGTSTDSYLFHYEEGGFDAPFGNGLDSAKVWKGVSRWVFNARGGLKLITQLQAGRKQPEGMPETSQRTSYEWEFNLEIPGGHTFDGYVKNNSWGPYDYYKQFDSAYPWQYKLDYSYGLERFLKKIAPDRYWRSASIGVKGLYRTLGEESPAEEYLDGENDYMFEVTTYFNYEF